MFPKLPTVTKGLLLTNVVVFLFQMMLGENTFATLMLWPLGGNSSLETLISGASFMPWQLLTYGFLHEGFQHLFFNMLAVFMFGAALEHTWGEKRFLTYYLVCVAGAGVCQLLVSWLLSSGTPVLGASGGVFGLLMAYGMLFPNERILLIFPPIPMKARTFVILYGVIELLMGITGIQPNVAHFTHLGGMLFGWLLIRYWRGQPPFGGSGRKPKPPYIRMVP
ncbi:MAG TPA: rhomboid family intramembrane serine protease [Xylella fastidiosa subsp. pauca]